MELVLDPERETGEHHVAMPVTVRDSITAPRHLVKPSNRRDQLRKTATKAPTP